MEFHGDGPETDNKQTQYEPTNLGGIGAASGRHRGQPLTGCCPNIENNLAEIGVTWYTS